MVDLVYLGLFLSLVANAALATFLYKKKHILTVDAKALLNQITGGGATVRIEVLDTSNMFYRSPRA